MKSGSKLKAVAIASTAILGLTTVSPVLALPSVAAENVDQSQSGELVSTLAENQEVTVTVGFETSNAEETLMKAEGAQGTWSIKLHDGHLMLQSQGGEQDVDLRYPVASDRKANLADGSHHTVAVEITESGTRVFLDGQYAHSTTAHVSPAELHVNAVTTGEGVKAAAEPGATAQLKNSPEALLPKPIVSWGEQKGLSPKVPLKNHISDRPDMAELSSGTMFVEFQTTARGVVSLISASDTTVGSTNLTLALNDGEIVVENRVDGRNSMNFKVPGKYNDGQVHSVALTVSPRGSVLYADGSPVERHSSTTFLADLKGMNGLWLGGNVDDGGDQWQLSGDILKASIFDAALTAQGVATVSGVQLPESVPVFDHGYEGSAAYRIPSLIKLQDGTLLAAADQRTASPYDSPNHIQTVVRRSSDNGKTWENIIVALPEPGAGRSGASAIDSALVQDSSTGDVVMVVDTFPGGVGQGNAKAGAGFDDQGRKILHAKNGGEFVLDKTGAVLTPAGEPTKYTVNGDGDVLFDGKSVGNYHLGGQDPASLKETETSFISVLRSSDGGRTWSKPHDFTDQVKEPWMKFLGTGPGRAVQIRHGNNAGRIVVPIYFNSVESPRGVYSSAVIYSDDGGKTWARGGSPNDGRTVGGQQIDPRTLKNSGAATHEATVVDLEDGRLVMFMRNPGRFVLRSESSDGGKTWSEPTPLREVPDIFSQPNAMTMTDPASGEEIIVFANASRRFPGDSGRRNERGRGIIRISRDGGLTWGNGRVFRDDTFVYSSMTQLNDGTIGLLWEMEWDGLYFAQLPLEWISEGKVQ